MQLDLTSTALRLELTESSEVQDIFEIFEKTEYTFTGVFRDNTGAVVDPAGKAIQFSVYEKPGGSLIKTWATGSGITAAANQFTMSIAATDVAVGGDFLSGQYEAVLHNGAATTDPVLGRVQGLAVVRDVNTE